MKLVEALELGRDCGLETVGECLLNVNIHQLSLFSVGDTVKEIGELVVEYEALKEYCSLIGYNTTIEDAMNILEDGVAKVVLEGIECKLKKE